MKTTLLMIGADKGGVGKTMVSRAVSDYLSAQGLQFRAFDTESPAGVLKRFNARTTEVVDLAQVSEQMKVFDTLGTVPITLIDVRAGLLSPTLKNLGDIGLLDLVKDDKLQLVVLHVLGPSMASLQEIEATANAIPGAKHFLVKNHINETKFFEWDPETKALADQRSGIIEVPRLDPLAAEHLEKASVSFTQFGAGEDQNNNVANYSFVLRGYVRTWLKTVYAALDGAKLNTILSQ